MAEHEERWWKWQSGRNVEGLEILVQEVPPPLSWHPMWLQVSHTPKAGPGLFMHWFHETYKTGVDKALACWFSSRPSLLLWHWNIIAPSGQLMQSYKFQVLKVAWLSSMFSVTQKHFYANEVIMSPAFDFTSSQVDKKMFFEVSPKANLDCDKKPNTFISPYTGLTLLINKKYAFFLNRLS